MTLFMLCIKIFLVRIVDVSLGTFVTILTVKGKRLIAMIIGFIDVIIWFLIVKEALNTDIKSIWIAIAYAGGYAGGTFIGTTLSGKLIKGKISVQVVIDESESQNVEKIRDAGYAVSQVNCTGKDNAKKLMLFIEVDKQHLNDLKEIVKKIDKDAFLIINETKYVENGFFK
ncbi:MAG: DUF5698 domain-containing protein [Bacilli bacterium]|nr:DUF5698 domain-containing protein [Bacilli bacterium]